MPHVRNHLNLQNDATVFRFRFFIFSRSRLNFNMELVILNGVCSQCDLSNICFPLLK